jgi:hypothetical protein
MARSPIPDPLSRRHLIERQLNPEAALRVAEAYLEQGRTVEAVEFLRKAGAAERLDALRREAVESGDAFLLRSVGTASGRRGSASEWRALQAAANAAGKLRYAADAGRQADRGEG